MSCCTTAVEAANKAVTPPKTRTLLCAPGLKANRLSVRISKNTPATTIVDLWSRAETGVGPSMAAGSQGCSPNCADLPAAANIRPNNRKGVKEVYCGLFGSISLNFQDLTNSIDKAIKVISPISPIRLYITASNAALFASFRVVHHLIRRNDKNPTPSQPRNIRKRLFEQVRINIFSKKIVNRRKKAVDFGSLVI